MKECDNSTRKIHISSNFVLSISVLIMFDTLLLRPSLHCNKEKSKYSGTRYWLLTDLMTYSVSVQREVDCIWNVMTHAQKPDFVFRRNGRVNLKRLGASVQSTTGSRGVRIIGSNTGHTIFRGSVKGTGYTLHSPVSPSLPLPCITVCHHIPTGL